MPTWQSLSISSDGLLVSRPPPCRLIVVHSVSHGSSFCTGRTAAEETINRRDDCTKNRHAVSGDRTTRLTRRDERLQVGREERL